MLILLLIILLYYNVWVYAYLCLAYAYFVLFCLVLYSLVYSYFCLLLFCMFHVKLFFFTCNTTCLMLVNVHENHAQIYIIRYREWIFCYNNEIETCHNCNLLYFKYSTVSIHKQSRVIFLSLLILICYYRVFYLEVLRLKLTTSWLFIIPLRIDPTTSQRSIFVDVGM